MSDNLGEAIKDRVRQGFVEWNKGYEAWLKWCDILYEPEAHYNIYGKRLTLQEYKDMMGELLSSFYIELGDFHNMLTQDD